MDRLGVVPGGQATVTGTLKGSSGLLTIVPASGSDVRFRPGGRPIDAEQVATSDVGEATEGRIVRVSGKITQALVSDLPYGYKFFVDDGSGELQIFVNVQAGIDLSGLTAGDQVSISGFSSQFESHYEIDPRSQDDITAIGPQR